jgi:thiamine biosynthesis lipoprotein
VTTIRLARLAMNTRFEFVLRGEREVALRAAGEEALDEITRLESQLSLYRRDSELNQINARAAREPVRVSPPLFRLLARAQEIWAATDGAFDLTIAPLMRAWKFVRDTGALPDAAELAAARACVGMQHVELDVANFTVRFARPGVVLDPGAIGKGWALERAGLLLREAGVTDALLHGGTSTVLALGTDEKGAPWRIAIEHPANSLTPQPSDAEGKGRLAIQREPERLLSLSLSSIRNGGEGARRAGEEESVTPLLAVVPLRDEALSVSAVWGKAFTAGGRVFGHVMDPRTGGPTDAAVLAAIAHPSATDTDALSTALLTLGIGGLEKIAAFDARARALVVARGAEPAVFQVATSGIEVNSV